MNEFVSVDEWLRTEESSRLLFLLSPVAGRADLVRVTPWLRAVGPLATLSLDLPRTAIAGVRPVTEGTSPHARPVQLAFRPESAISFDELYRQIADRLPAAGPAGAILHLATSWKCCHEGGVNFSFGLVRLASSQVLHINVAYPPLKPAAPGTRGSRGAVRVVVDCDVYAESANDLAGSVPDGVLRIKFVERQSRELTLEPGEAISIDLGEERISSYAASQLSLLGVAEHERKGSGITVTGTLQTRSTGETVAVLPPRTSC